MTDDTLMPWGAHRGKPMSEVPDDYLLFIWEKRPQWVKSTPGMKEYIEDNLDAIKVNVQNAKG